MVRAETTIESLQKQIDELEALKKSSEEATRPLENELASLEQKIRTARSGITQAKQQIEQREKDTAIQYVLLSGRVAQQYKRSRTLSPLMLLFTSASASDLTKNLAYGSSVQAQDNRMIREFSEEIIRLEEDQRTLAALEVQLETQAKYFETEIGKARSYQQTLSTQIASLSAQQQQLIAQRQAGLKLPASLGAGPLSCVDDRKRDPGFGNAYAFFTFGIPHRVGLNQYGAQGRAKAGQSAEEILKAYFNNFEFVNGKENETVIVNGRNEFGQTFNNESMNIEEYLKHLHEMPTSWESRALEAQAIAARSYALAIMKASGSLRPSQADQVIKKELNAPRWIDAVNATRGKIMAQGGQPIKAWYASTAGGYTFNSGDVWTSNTSYTKRLRDTTGDVSSFGDLQSKAYDKDSPCFYSAQGWRSQYASSAWLKGEEVADIANVILLARADDSTKVHLYQTDKPHPYGGEVWNESRVRQELQNRGITPLTNVSNASASGVDWGVGRTTQIKIEGHTFNGDEFKNWFNLRAPANIQIVGPLFNIEKK